MEIDKIRAAAKHKVFKEPLNIKNAIIIDAMDTSEIERQLTWGEIKEIMDNNGVKESDIVDDIGYWGHPTLPERAMVHREKLTDDKYHVTLNFKD